MRQFLTILTLIAILASAKPLSEQSAEEPVAGLPVWLVAAISQPKPIAILVNGEKAEVTPMFALSEAKCGRKAFLVCWPYTSFIIFLELF